MELFLNELDLLLEWAQSTHDTDLFEKEFTDLVYEYRTVDGIVDIANVIAHNYDCHKYNRKDAIIHNMAQWESYTK